MSDQTPGAEPQSDPDQATGEERKGFTFGDMCLAVGDRLQLECSASTGVRRAFVRVVGYLEGVSLLVTTPTRGGRRINLVENDPLIVRVFSRQSAFAFRASVLRVCRLPFDYLHLSFPGTIQGSVIRKATRVRARIPVRMGAHGSDAAEPGTILNLSATGALIHARAAVGEQGSVLRLRFVLTLHEVEFELDIAADVRSVQQEADTDGEGIEYHYGVDFHALAPDDRMKIKSLVYQTIIEQPRQVI
jgi:hypothetical protein